MVDLINWINKQRLHFFQLWYNWIPSPQMSIRCLIMCLTMSNQRSSRWGLKGSTKLRDADDSGTSSWLQIMQYLLVNPHTIIINLSYLAFVLINVLLLPDCPDLRNRCHLLHRHFFHEPLLPSSTSRRILYQTQLTLLSSSSNRCLIQLLKAFPNFCWFN